jgi:glycosyltransferase involved in cell wall biosynthesis
MNLEKKPTISIVLPTYNRADLLKRAVQSVFEQSFSDFELIIINDASVDGTRVFCDELAKKDARVRPVHHERNYYPGISRTLNEGLGLARGKYIARLDDDDYWCDPDKLKKQAAFLDGHPDYMVVGSGMVVVDAEGKELFRYLKPEADGAIRKSALFANPFSHTTVMFRKKEAVETGGYKNWNYAEDWDLWLSLGERGSLYNFPEYFACYTMSGTNNSLIHQRTQSKTILKIISSHRKTYPGFFFAYSFNFFELAYSSLPLFLRKRLHASLSRLKRKSSSY